MNECFLWYHLTWVALDNEPLNVLFLSLWSLLSKLSSFTA